MQLPDLPICTSLPELKKALAAGSAVLAAPPGSGKTTIVPLALLDEPWLAGKKILILEPRRLAARAAASRMSSLVGERVGKTVGYQIRFDRQVSPATRIEVVTEGILTRRLQGDPDLSDVGLIIFDEFHEHSIHTDLALALCLDIRQLKEDLRLLVMSATLDTAPIARLLGDVPIITGTGQSHEVTIEYLEKKPRGPIFDITALGVQRMLARHEGDVLVFLPGVGEIRRVEQILRDNHPGKDILILPLYGNMSQKDQDRAILPDKEGRRRVILATSIAETSLTIEGVTLVVDSGWSRRMEFEKRSGLSRLITVRVSKAVADQRTGRAGRLAPGHCLRLWTTAEQHSFPPFHPPEILTADLAGLALELALWGVRDPLDLQWIDPPRAGAYRQAWNLLESLDAVDSSGHITPIGRQMAHLPVHPRLSRMLINAKEDNQGPLACEIAALLSERDVRKKGTRNTTAEISVRWQLLKLWQQKGNRAVQQEGGDPQACRLVDKTAQSFRKILKVGTASGDADEIGTLLVSAYPDRVARKRSSHRERYQLASGKGAVLPPADPLSASEYIVAANLDAGNREGRIFLAEPLDLFQLKKKHARIFTRRREISWDATAQKVAAFGLVCIGELIVEKHPLSDVRAEEMLEAMLTGIRQNGLECLPWDKHARQVQARICCMRKWYPQQDWPDISDTALLENLNWLEPYLSGMNRTEQLKQIKLEEVFKAMLSWEQQQQLKRDAPPGVQVPSGSVIGLNYLSGELPVLAVRIQEMFGSTETPAICGGKVRVLLHLLSPAGRPVQVTSDLNSFWQRSYPEVKKELKGRYPKHFWPDDPLEAPPTRRTKKKMKKQ